MVPASDYVVFKPVKFGAAFPREVGKCAFPDVPSSGRKKNARSNPELSNSPEKRITVRNYISRPLPASAY